MFSLILSDANDPQGLMSRLAPNKQISKDPGSNYYASSELVNNFTKGYIMCATLVHFGMDTNAASPTKISMSVQLEMLAMN